MNTRFQKKNYIPGYGSVHKKQQNYMQKYLQNELTNTTYRLELLKSLIESISFSQAKQKKTLDIHQKGNKIVFVMRFNRY